ncbi:hypothetical protein [Sporomusa acidovorans]|uniref:hypothetical protein n=1 Tax=Sporomusa acidovorans TaxID=112900 RepID=UPI0015A12FC1|nr:hypothetical protein [Sporomusa acidovorans]
MMHKRNHLVDYYYAARNYLHTPKGRHDAIDYARAAAIILGISALLGWIMTRWISM